jgi:antitoxin CptB
MDKDSEYRKLCWRSKRGMLELDRLLAPFVQDKYLNLTQREQALYQELLTFDDTDLLDWLVYKIPPTNNDLQKIISLIVQHVPTH